MIEWGHPGLIFIFGAFLIPLFKGKWKQAYLLLPPTAAFIDLLVMSRGAFGTIPYSAWHFPFLEYELVFGRVDKLSMVFGYIFVIAAFCTILYALHVKSSSEHMSAFFYVGGAIGVVFAGDLFTLYIFWEIMSIASMLLIWFHGGRGSEKAHEAGFRYIIWHLFGGVILLAGIIMHVQATGSTAFNAFSWGLGSEYLASYLIFFGFIVNAAVPPLHAWLPDAYPEATCTGGVFLSAFTTKAAVYTLLRGFQGVEILIFLGVMMTIYGIIYALLENDARRILAYSIINQVGFMLAGIGIGTPLAICGVVSHAFCHILYKGLLWMSAGSVLFMTGKSKCTDLGGLYKTMPLTCFFGLIGAFSISAFPLTNGFTSKPMTIAAAAEAHMGIIWLLLMVASAGVFLHAGVKFPYFVFFAKDRGIKTRDPPINQLLGMGLTAFLCIFLGVYPQPLYNLLPYPVDFVTYTIPHVVGMLSLLGFSGLAFFMLLPLLKRTETISIDTDWPFRIAGRKFIWFCEVPLPNFARMVDNGMKRIASHFSSFGRNPLRAIQITLSTIMVKALKAFILEFWWRLYQYYERDLEKAKSRPLDEPMETVPMGTAVLLIIIFFLLYLIVVLMYGWLAP
ncbi:MAG: Na(+)/H(+) antiporter subunit D [Euryarchaeota archaeon]|nr:Na(+)/H(+) antiporter subunit D [Euryarchaeota archaeon]